MITAARMLLIQIIDLYWWVVIIAVVASWLVGFGVVNSYNPLVRSILRAVHALTEPVFGPFRRLLPAMPMAANSRTGKSSASRCSC